MNEDSNNTLAQATEQAPLEVEGLPSAQEMIRLFVPNSVRKPLWRILMSGYMKPPRTEPKPIKFWYNGNLITKEEHDKLSVDVVRASTDVITSSRLARFLRSK
jgi:hypothetical protein